MPTGSDTRPEAAGNDIERTNNTLGGEASLNLYRDASAGYNASGNTAGLQELNSQLEASGVLPSMAINWALQNHADISNAVSDDAWGISAADLAAVQDRPMWSETDKLMAKALADPATFEMMKAQHQEYVVNGYQGISEEDARNFIASHDAVLPGAGHENDRITSITYDNGNKATVYQDPAGKVTHLITPELTMTRADDGSWQQQSGSGFMPYMPEDISFDENANIHFTGVGPEKTEIVLENDGVTRMYDQYGVLLQTQNTFGTDKPPEELADRMEVSNPTVDEHNLYIPIVTNGDAAGADSTTVDPSSEAGADQTSEVYIPIVTNGSTDAAADAPAAATTDPAAATTDPAAATTDPAAATTDPAAATTDPAAAATTDPALPAGQTYDTYLPYVANDAAATDADAQANAEAAEQTVATTDQIQYGTAPTMSVGRNAEGEIVEVTTPDGMQLVKRNDVFGVLPADGNQANFEPKYSDITVDNKNNVTFYDLEGKPEYMVLSTGEVYDSTGAKTHDYSEEVPPVDAAEQEMQEKIEQQALAAVEQFNNDVNVLATVPAGHGYSTVAANLLAANPNYTSADIYNAGTGLNDLLATVRGDVIVNGRESPGHTLHPGEVIDLNAAHPETGKPWYVEIAKQNAAFKVAMIGVLSKRMEEAGVPADQISGRVDAIFA